MKPQGIVVPLLTPLHESGALDEQGLRSLVEHVVLGGVHGLFVAGTTGEFARLEDAVRHRLFALTVRFCNGRVPVYAGVSDSAIGAVESHLQAAKAAGADFCVASLPYYFPVSQGAEAARWFQRVLDRAQLPVLLYDIPGNVGSLVPPDSLAVLRGDVAGMKDSSGVASRLEEYQARLGTVLCGSESLLVRAAELGLAGMVPSMANVFPALWARAWELRADPVRLTPIAALVDSVNRLNARYDSSTGHVAWKKRALWLMGVCGPYVAFPAAPAPAEDDALLKKRMAEVDALLQAL